MKRTSAFVVIATLGLFLIGCARTELRISRIAPATHEASHRPSFVDIGAMRIGDEALSLPFKPYHRIDSPHLLRFDVKHAARRRYLEYSGVVSPPPRKGERSRFGVDTSEPTTSLESGWILVWGQWPVVKTQEIVIGAEGTVYAVEIVDANLTRVYLSGRSASGCRVSCRSDSSRYVRLTQPGTFVEVRGGCQLGTPAPFGAPQLSFMNAAEAAAIAAGWSGVDQ